METCTRERREPPAPACRHHRRRAGHRDHLLAFVVEEVMSDQDWFLVALTIVAVVNAVALGISFVGLLRLERKRGR